MNFYQMKFFIQYYYLFVKSLPLVSCKHWLYFYFLFETANVSNITLDKISTLTFYSAMHFTLAMGLGCVRLAHDIYYIYFFIHLLTVLGHKDNNSVPGKRYRFWSFVNKKNGSEHSTIFQKSRYLEKRSSWNALLSCISIFRFAGSRFKTSHKALVKSSREYKYT